MERMDRQSQNAQQAVHGRPQGRDDASGARLSQFAGVQWDTMDRAGRAAAEAAGTTIRLAGSTMKERFFRMMKPVQEAWIERASKAGYDARAALAELRRSARAHDDAR